MVSKVSKSLIRESAHRKVRPSEVDYKEGAHEDFLEMYADREDGTRYSRFYRDHPYAMELLRNFGNVTARQFHWTRVMGIDEFVTMALSSTQVQRALDKTGEKEGVRTIRTYCSQYSDDNGKLVVPYVTELYFSEIGPGQSQ